MDNVSITPGLSNHNIVVAQVNAKPETTKHVPRIIALYKKADWDQLQQSMRVSTQNSNTMTLLPPMYKVCGISLLPDFSKV